MKKILSVFILSISFGAQASFFHWFNSTDPGSRHFWENGQKAGSRYFWENGTKAGSRYYWENSTAYPSRYFWENSTKPGSSHYWRNGTGPGSRYYFENGKGPGSQSYWYNQEKPTFDIYFVTMCKSGVIDIPPCQLMFDELSPIEIIPHSPDHHYCEEPSLNTPNNIFQKPINSKPNSL